MRLKVNFLFEVRGIHLLKTRDSFIRNKHTNILNTETYKPVTGKNPVIIKYWVNISSSLHNDSSTVYSRYFSNTFTIV